MFGFLCGTLCPRSAGFSEKVLLTKTDPSV
jgi:hypothetical protein